jgi:hypothetical protein
MIQAFMYADLAEGLAAEAVATVNALEPVVYATQSHVIIGRHNALVASIQVADREALEELIQERIAPINGLIDPVYCAIET